jgi:hypothetical protein
MIEFRRFQDARAAAFEKIHKETLQKRNRVLNNCERLKIDIARKLKLK